MNAAAVSNRIRPLGRGTSFGGVAATILIHVGLGALVYFAHVKSPPPIEAPRDLIVTQLVALGKPRDKFWLPRIVQPPRPKAPAPTLNLTEDANAASQRRDGNNVDLDKELGEMSSNTMQYNTLTEFVSASLRQLRVAIVGRS